MFWDFIKGALIGLGISSIILFALIGAAVVLATIFSSKANEIYKDNGYDTD